MLTKNQDAGQASADVRRPPARVRSSAAVIEIINEPKSDWVPPWKAPFYCFMGGYIRSAREWAEALQTTVQKIIESDEWAYTLQADRRKILEAEGIMETEYRPGRVREWSFDRATDDPGAAITAMGLRMHIRPGIVSVTIPYKSRIEFRCISLGHSNDMLKDLEWDKALPHEPSLDEKVAAQWHRHLLCRLFWFWERTFAQAIESGTLHIMARKHSVLAPFERITWNQWQYFRVDQELPRPKDPKWGNPQLPRWRRSALPWTALGPADEKLYEIHVAPGLDTSNSSGRDCQNDPEERCLKWLAELIHDYPDRQPKRRDLLAQDAVLKFPGLTLNRFLRCWTLAQEQTQNHNWSEPGRLKSPQKIAAVEIDRSAISLSRRK